MMDAGAWALLGKWLIRYYGVLLEEEIEGKENSNKIRFIVCLWGL